MIPVIVGGGVITAIAKMMGGYNIGDTAAEMQTLAQVISQLVTTCCICSPLSGSIYCVCYCG